MSSLAKTEKAVKIRLGDGNEYEMIPIDLNIMVEIEDKFEKPFGSIFRDGWVKPLRYTLWRLIKESAPEIKTEADLGNLITAKVLTDLQKILTKQLEG